MTEQTSQRRLLIGLASSAMSYGLAGVQAIVLVPLFVAAWAPEAYGRWLAISAIASHLTIADLGGQNYVANLLAMHFGRDEESDFRSHLSEAVSLFLAIGLGLLSMLVVALVWAAGKSAPLLGGNEALALLFLGTNSLIVSVPGGVYASVYRSSGQFARGALIGNTGRLLNIIGLVVLLLLKVSPAVVAAWILINAVGTTLAVIIDSRRAIPGCRGVRVRPSLAVSGARRFAFGSLHFCLIGLAAEINEQGLVLVLAAVASPVAVAVYATHRILATIPSRLATIAQGPLAPELTFLWARRRREDLVKVSLLATTTFMALGALAAAALWAIAPVAYGFWTSHAMRFDAVLACLLIVQSILASGWQTSAWSLLATNQHHALARWSAGKAAMTLALSWPLGRSFGASGIAAAALLADIVCGAVAFPASAGAMLGIPATQFYGRIALGLIPLVPITASVLAAGRLGDISPLVTTAGAGAATALLAVGLAGPFVLPTMRAAHARWRA